MSRVDSAFLAVHKARAAGPRPGRQRARLRRLLPLRRRRRAGRRRRRDRDHPARRLGARRRGDRGGQPARHGHGDDRPPPVPTLDPGPHDRHLAGTPALPLGARPPSLVVLADLPRDAGADHRVLGHLRVHRRRQGARHPAPAGQSALRRSWPTSSACCRWPRRTRCGSTCSRRSPAPRAAGLWFLVAERWLRGIVPHRWARYGAAFGGVLVGATSWTVWNQSTVNEKVYTVSLLSIALVMWLVVRWGDDEPGPHRDRWLVLIAYVLALTSTNHLMGLLAVPGARRSTCSGPTGASRCTVGDRDVLRPAAGGHRQVARHVHRRRRHRDRC